MGGGRAIGPTQTRHGRRCGPFSRRHRVNDRACSQASVDPDDPLVRVSQGLVASRRQHHEIVVLKKPAEGARAGILGDRDAPLRGTSAVDARMDLNPRSPVDAHIQYRGDITCRKLTQVAAHAITTVNQKALHPLESQRRGAGQSGCHLD